jgi:hypothetical protein
MWPKQKGTRQKLGPIFLLFVLGIAALMVSCRPESTSTTTPAATATFTPGVTLVIPTVEKVELPFETIERIDWLYEEREHEPVYEQRLVLVTNQAELERLKNHISTKAMGHLSELGYEEYFVIAVFRGGKPTPGYDVEIERIVKQDDKIVVYAQFWEPNPLYGFSERVTAPYHLVKVRKPVGLVNEFELLLQTIWITPTPP